MVLVMHAARLLLLPLIVSLAVAPVEIDSIGSLVVTAAGLILVRGALDHLRLVQKECHVAPSVSTAAVVRP